MPLSAGQRLGSYEILALVGVGGMGEVYRARDTKLDRDVAVKILPAALADDPERLARLEREAKVLASLNHPNIAQIYGIEDGALVMELVDGEPLKGPLPIESALNAARQIAEAVEAAHEKGIVHRDLKPANIMMTPAGVVKVLDFGLAKAGEEPANGGDPSISPTLTARGTLVGTIMGTAAYMSPEQAVGKAVDKRTDIWSFGVVLFEMLAGVRLFDGETISHAIADVLRAPIDLDKLPKETPPAIRRLLGRCLDRNPKTRLRDIGEARIAIEEALRGAPADVSPRAAPVQASTMGWKIAAGVCAAVAVALGVVAFLNYREKSPLEETARFEIGPPPNGHFTCCLSISPDGRKIAFTAEDSTDGLRHLWVRALDTVEAKMVYANLVGGVNAPHPFWSSDSRYVAFSTAGKLRKVEASGGPSQTLCDTPLGYTGGTWSRDGVIIIDGAAGLSRVSADGGEAAPLTRIDPSRQESAHSGPAFLPDGRHFLYLVRSSHIGSSGILVGSLDANPERQGKRRLIATDYPADYAPSADSDVGQVLFLRESTLMAQPFDAAKLEPAGEAVPVADPVATSNGRGIFAVSAGGALIYRAAGPYGQNRRFTWFDRRGKVLSQLGDAAEIIGDIALSPDGTRVASERGSDAASDIWVLDSHGVSTRLTFDAAANGAPVWSPDGEHIAFRSNRGGQSDLYQKPSNGAADEVLLLKSDEAKIPTDWSRDGRFLIFTTHNVKTNSDLWVLPLAGVAGSSEPAPVLRTEFYEGCARFSPDGRWIAYISSESGRAQAYVRPFASTTGETESAGKWQISKDGAGYQQPRWRSDGKELFFMAGQSVMAVEVSVTPVFRSGNPRPLFRLPLGVVRWDVTADGKRFVAAVPADGGGNSDPMIVMLNWTAGLKRRQTGSR